jgi:tetratricopeptide (TPR) repeat protein
MVNHLLGTEHVESALEEFILEKTEGIPFFIEEFIKSLRDLQIIERKDNTYRIAKDIQTVTIPSTIQDVIMARVDSLPEIAKGVLQTGSVVGREFSHDLINRVIELPKEELLSNLSVLKDSELVYERGIYPQSTYIFKHALTQDVAYNSLLLKRRKEIHERIGRAIEEIYAERLEEFYEMLAYHYSKSDDSEKAYQYLKLSGEKATRNYSTWEAFRFCKAAMEALKKKPENEENLKERIEILRLILGPIRTLGYPEDSLQLLEEGERISKERGDEKSLARFYSELGFYYSIIKGNPIVGTKYAEKCFLEAQKIKDIRLMARTAADLCASYNLMGEYWKVSDVARKVIVRLEETKKEHDSFGRKLNIYSILNVYYGWSIAWMGNFEEGKPFLEKGLRFASKIKDTTSTGFIEWFYGTFFLLMGDGKSAVEHIKNSIRHLEEAKFLTLLGLAWTFLGWGYYFMGELETAKKHLENGRKIQTDAGISFNLSASSLVLAMIHFDSGDLTSAQSSIEEALRLSQNHNERNFEGFSKIWLGRILGKGEKSPAGRSEEYILHGIEILDELKLKPWLAQGRLFLGEFYGGIDKKDKALENLKKAEEMFQDMGMDYWLPRTEEILGRL